jgi:hypothetical protein
LALSLADIIDYDLAMRGREQFLRTSARTGIAAMRHQRAAKNARRTATLHSRLLFALSMLIVVPGTHII